MPEDPIDDGDGGDAVTWDEPALLEEASAALSPLEFDRLALLPPAARRSALVRLHQVVRWNAGRRGRDRRVDEHLIGTSVGAFRFYKFARDFARTGSVAALGIAMPGAVDGAVVPRRGSRLEADRRRAEATMLGMLRERPTVGTDELVAAVRRLDLDRQPSLSALYKWAVPLRAGLASNPFGSPVVVLATVDAWLEPGIQHDVALALDSGTGLVLGAAVATGTSVLEAYAGAMRDGVERLAGLRLPGVRAVAGPVTLRVADVPDPNAISGTEAMSFMRRHHVGWEPIDLRAAERELRTRIGRSLGPLRMSGRPLPWRVSVDGARTATMPRSKHGGPATSAAPIAVGRLSAFPTTEEIVAAYGTGSDESGPAVPLVGADELGTMIARAVDEHDRTVLARFGGGREGATARDVRQRTIRVLETMRSEGV